SHLLTGVAGPYRLEQMQLPGDSTHIAPQGLIFGSQEYFLRAINASTLEVLDSAGATTAIDLLSQGEGGLLFTRVLSFGPAGVSVNSTPGASDPITLNSHGLSGTLGPVY